MRPRLCLSLLIGTLGIAQADSMPIVMMSGKAITPRAPSITFTIQNPGRAAAKTHVLTMTGQEVAELSALSLNRFVWDGKDVDQQDVDPGFYVVQIQQNGSFWHGPVIVKR